MHRGPTVKWLMKVAPRDPESSISRNENPMLSHRVIVVTKMGPHESDLSWRYFPRRWANEPSNAQETNSTFDSKEFLFSEAK